VTATDTAGSLFYPWQAAMHATDRATQARRRTEGVYALALTGVATPELQAMVRGPVNDVTAARAEFDAAERAEREARAAEDQARTLYLGALRAALDAQRTARERALEEVARS
jgi:hypothetical protein